MVWLRRILFYVFLTLYLILCPLTVLYALGYLYKPGPVQSIVKSGLISLATAPPGATIYVGTSRYPHRTPTVLRDLVPGRYPIRVLLKNRRPWAKTILVETGKATVLERVLLLPQRLQGRAVLPLAFEELIPLPGSEVFLLRTGPTLGEYVRYAWKEREARPLLPPDSPWAQAKPLARFTVEGSPVLVLHVAGRTGEQFLWINPREAQASITEFTHLVPQKPFQIDWDPRDPEQLFVFQAGSLSRVDLTNGAIYPQLVDQVRGYGVIPHGLCVLRQQPAVERVDREGQHVQPLLDDPALAQSLFGAKGFFEVIPLTDEILVFLGERGELVASRLPYRFVDRGVLGVAGDPARKRLLVWQRDRVGVLDFSGELDADEVFERGPTMRWLLRGGESIQQAFWVYGGSHALIRDRDRVLLLEVDTYGPSNVYPLVSVKPGSAIWYAEETGQLYYLDKAAGQLHVMDILPLHHPDETGLQP